MKQTKQIKKLLYGAAYYDEYMPCERLEQDMELMKKANINVIRIAESTWSTEEPDDGVFDFSHVTRVLEACEKHGLSVIVGTPTYAIPAWLARKHPEVMVTDQTGRRPYGARQIMDITHPAYLFHCERIIRKLMEAVSGYDCVIGYQLDNETKHFGTSSSNVQQMFVRWVKKKFDGDIEAMNRAYGLDYWSNRINAWEDFPSMTGTINGSLGCEFERFQRQLVTDFLHWQSKIVREYCRDDQFITHNFDCEWKDYSYGVQPDVDHFKAAEALTIAGCDIYHPSQGKLTGKEIAFCGDLTRSLKKDNYLLIETEAQGFPEWTPYPGQLRLQAFSHLANGANSVMYWHWHSLHNAIETYWKGILSHDLEENEVYREACTIGKSFADLSDRLVNLKKENKVAILVSNEALTALKWFQLPGGAASYNDIVRWLYDAFYELNVECDLISPEEERLEQYDIIAVPALYSAPQETLMRLVSFAENGGTVIATFKTGFTDENVKVRAVRQPAELREAFGISYQQFTAPVDVTLTGDDFDLESGSRAALAFMELLMPEGAEVAAHYDHPAWNRYAAITEHSWGKGKCCYLGCMTTPEYLKSFLEKQLKACGLWTWKQENTYPLVIREGINEKGKAIRYYFNYSGEPKRFESPEDAAVLLWSGNDSAAHLAKGEKAELPAWGLCITSID